MPGPIYFAWADAGADWDPSMLREDEEIFAVEISHVEGGFPSLKIDLKNPRVGLLAAGRNLWCWLSYGPDPLTLPFPIFHGRLIGVPENLQDEVVRLEFIARPADFKALKAELAQTMKLAPYWDPVWLKDKVDDPDTILEGYPRLWHVDRVTNEVTASDIIQGEDGIVDVTESNHFYDAMSVTYGQTPLRRVKVTGKVNWTQNGGGSLDLTPALVRAFQDSGSPLSTPLIASLTGDGLLSSWPAPGTAIGSGWIMGLDSSVEKADWIKQVNYKKVYTDYDVFPEPAPLPPPDPNAQSHWGFPHVWSQPSSLIGNVLWATLPTKTYGVVFPVTTLSVNFTLGWAATRKRAETVSFTLEGDVQSIVTEADEADELTLAYASDAITDAIDENGAVPLDDPLRPSYFLTARGARSFENLVVLARAKLLARARCVLIKFIVPWDFVIEWISCRYDIRLFDSRLPGGVCSGKITGYILAYSTDHVQAEITIACTIGRGGSVAPEQGQPSYAQDGYMDPAENWQTFLGSQASLVPGEIVYLSFDNFALSDDDGIDFFNMTPAQALLPTKAVDLTTTANIRIDETKLRGLADTTDLLQEVIYGITGDGIPAGATLIYNGSGAGTLSVAATATSNATSVHLTGAASSGILVTNGLDAQTAAIDAGITKVKPDPVAALKNAPTRICLNLKSLDGTFSSEFDMQVSPLLIPKTVDLEAA